MTLQLIELLTTLVQRPNVQEVVKQGINPLLITVSSYMILEKKDHRIHYADDNYFLHDKTQSIFKMRTIKNQCSDLVSSLIEVFGDQAVHSTLYVITCLLDVEGKFEA
jgi:2-hydroxy-3-keto-5-methylthiopentenyl-1-phosphate phosphatase